MNAKYNQIFLRQEKPQVVLDRRTSKRYEINAGVLQWLILGLLLFPIFINSLPNNIVAEMGIFADDSTLYNRHVEKTDVHKSKTMAECVENNFQFVVK